MNSQTSVNASLRSKVNLSPEGQDHRFLPSEKPRSVALNQALDRPQLASEVSFNPVATINSGANATYVAPVKNTSNRPVSPGVLSKNGQIAIRGEHIIELNQNLHDQIKAKVNQKTPYQKQTLVKPSANVLPQAKPAPTSIPNKAADPAQAKARTEQLKQQLAGINKVLFEQIQQKISSEIARQKGVPVPAPSQPKAPAFKEPRTISTPSPQDLGKVVPVKRGTNQVEASSILPNQAPTSALTTEAKPPVAVLPNQMPSSVPKTVTGEPLEKNKESLETHIANIEGEIEALTKEIHHIDQTISSLEGEKNLQELTALENKLSYDEKMMEAVTNWKYSLTNLVNSHTLALKYLKQKTDWLEDKVENIEGHREKHQHMHRKPREVVIKLGKLPLQTGSAPQPQSQSPQTTASAPEVKINLPGETVSSSANVQATLTQTQPFTEVIKKEEAEPQQVKQAVKELFESNKDLQAQTISDKQLTEKVQKEVREAISEEGKALPVRIVKETESVSKEPPLGQLVVQKEVQSTPALDEKSVTEKVESLVKEQLEQQKESQKTLDSEEVAKMVAAAVEKKMAGSKLPTQISIASSGKTAEKPEAVLKLQTNETTGKLSKELPTTEIAANLTVGQPKVLEGNPAPQININAIPVETSAKPKENLPTVSTTAALSAQTDIERQILEQAAREEAAKEAVVKAKEEQERKRHEEEEAKKKQRQEKQKTTSEVGSVSTEAVKENLTQLKSSLTTVDNKSLETMSKEERGQMMQRLEALEHQNEVSRQMDDIKGVAERRKVNAEIKAMLERLGQKPKPQIIEPATQTGASTTGAPQQVETLKAAEKKERSPEEKARIIAEIKALEREREARKLEQSSRPVVKAQPAYGKMLPNTPTTANVINGIVKDNKGLLMDTVVIIVKDQAGDPVRAFKTNKIGQFAVSTPLPNGVYTLELEKQGYDFDIIEVEVNGGILPPIEIKAR